MSLTHISIRLSKSKIKKWCSKISLTILIFAWLFSGWPQIFNFPPNVQRVQAATVSAFPGTTAGAQDTSYASNDCSDNMAWDGTGSPGNASNSDDSYIAENNVALDSGDISDELQFSNFGIVIPGTGSTIDGVLVEIERFSAEAVTDAHVMITTTAGAQEGNDKSAGATWATSDPNSYVVSFGGSTDTWGATDGLTETEVEGTGFGVVLCVASGAANAHPSIDALRITVYYTNSAPTLTVSEPDGASDEVTVGDLYNVTYALSDSDNTVTAAFYYDANNSGLDGVAITGACATAAEDPTTTCSWDTTGMTPGSYYVYGIVDDGVNAAVSDYSSGQITINSAATSLTFLVTTDVFPALTPGTYVFATSTLSVDTDNAGGWNVTMSRDDADTTLDLSTDASINITDQADWVPGGSPASAGNAVKLSLLDNSGDVLAFRVMTASGTTSFISTAWWGNVDAYVDDTSSFWAGLPNTGQQIGNSSSDPSANPMLNTILYYLDVPSTQQTGTYNGSITFTATMN